MKTKHPVTIVALIGTIFVVGVYGCKEAKDYYKQGIAHRRKGERDLAISDFTKAIEMNPRFAMAYCYRGSLLINKAPDRAISDYTKAIEINPRLAVAYSGRALAYHHKREYDKAWDDVHKAESLGLAQEAWWPGFVTSLRKDSGRRR